MVKNSGFKKIILPKKDAQETKKSLKGEVIGVVAEVDEKVVASSEVGRRSGSMSHIGFLGVAVKKGYRGIGIGKELVKTLIEESKKTGSKVLVLEVFDSNTIAKSLYTKLGFKNAGRIPKGVFKRGKYIDLLSLFSENPELHNGLDVFNATKLAELLKKETAGEKIVLIDHMAFLWDTWADNEKKNFLTLVKQQWNSFYKDNNAILIFNIPSDYILSHTSITDTKGNSRIKDLTEFSAII